MAADLDLNQVVLEMEEVLKLDKAPADTDELPSVRPRRMVHLTKLLHQLKQLAKSQEEELNLHWRDKAFMEYAKASSNLYATLFNAVNTFGTGVSYLLHGNDSDHLRDHPHMRMVFTGMTLAFIPFTLLTVGLAHALPHNLNMMNHVALMLIMQAAYMATTGGLFSFFLINHSNSVMVILLSVFAFLFMVVPPAAIFRRPNHRDWGYDRDKCGDCTRNREE